MIKTEYDNYGNKLAQVDSYGLNSSVSGSLSRGFPRSFSIVGRGDLESISGSILYYWRFRESSQKISDIAIAIKNFSSHI